METININNSLHFLQGGGEMGAITRNLNWENNPLGKPEQWSESLRTTLGILLHSGFPMFLFWGKELICFYNDAYRPSLGIEGRHPAVGKPGEEVWPDIWHIIHPLIDNVMTTGESVYFEDSLIPIYRNGRLEDVYWTFSYSPAYEEGVISGVVVTCVETTEKVLNEKKLELNVSNLHNIILKAPVGMCILKGSRFVVDIANDMMYELWGKNPEQVLGKPIFEGLPEARDQGFEQLLNNVYNTGETFTAFGVPTLLPRDGGLETVYINFVYEAYREADGAISGVMAVGYDVSEQLLAGKKMAESEQKIRSFVENAPFPIGVYTGREMRIEFANQSIIDTWGKGSEVVGKLYSEVLPELQNQHIYEQLDQVYTTGIPFHAKNQRIDLVVENELRSFYFNYSFNPLFDLNGNVYGVMNTAANVTDLVKAKQKIEESEERFRLLADSLPQFVWAADKKGNPTYFNKKIHDYSGHTLDELKDGGWQAIIHPDERELSLQVWENSIATQTEFRIQHRFRSSNGEYRWYLSRAVPQNDAEGNTTMWIGTSADIHDHIIVEQELTSKVQETVRELETSQSKIKESAERLRAVFNNAQSGMFIFEPVKNDHGEVVDFRFVITNPMFASYVGQTPEILNGEPGSKWFPGYLHNGVFEIYKKTYLTGENQRHDIHYNVDGIDIYLDLQCVKLGEELLITFTDYTQLKTTQFQLEKYIEDLKRSNANLEDFAYAASHDMKEPIRKIYYFSDKIRESISKRFTEEETRYFERMEAAARRMGALIDDLLSYSQVSVRPRVYDDVDLNYVLKQVLGDLEIEIEQKNAAISMDELPLIKGHQRQVQQAFQNLLSNALKFHKPGEAPVIRITSRLVEGKQVPVALSVEEQHKKFHLIEVTDEGIGFDQSDADRIFNVFTRLHGNIDYHGTGIGLSIVKKVAENHGAYIIANGDMGKGAKFSLYWPGQVFS